MCDKLHIDRPVNSNSREVLIKWVGDFLWEWEGAISEPNRQGMLYGDAAKIIVDTIINVKTDPSNDEYKESTQLPNPESYFHN